MRSYRRTSRGDPLLLLGVSSERAAIISFVIYLVVYVSTATSRVAASESWPLIGVTPSAGPRLGPLSDPLGAYRRIHESFTLGRSVACTAGSRLEQRSGIWPSAPASMRAGGRPSRTACGPNHGASPTKALLWRPRHCVPPLSLARFLCKVSSRKRSISSSVNPARRPVRTVSLTASSKGSRR